MNFKRVIDRLRNPERADADLDEEVRSFYDAMATRRIDQGFEPGEAHRVTRAEYGPPALVVEEVRNSRVEAFFETAMHDVRYGLRLIRSNPGFTAVAVLTLALGIGANTAIYSLMESILLRSLPVSNPESLALLNWQSPTPYNANKEWVHVVHGVQGILWPGPRGTMVTGMFPYAAFEAFRQETGVFTTLFGYFDGRSSTLSINGHASDAGVEYVTGEYFRGLAVNPAAGRLIVSDDDRPGAAPVAVLSFAASQKRFGKPSSAVGQTIFVDNVAFTVVGIAPPGFFGVDPGKAPDLYLPVHTNVLVEGPESARMYHDQNFYWMEMMGRLRPGVSVAEAQALLSPRFERWVAATATTDGERARLPKLIVTPGAAGLGSLRRQYSKPLFVLAGMVGLILLLVCANIANLLLGRATARRREFAVRLSLGAGRFRVIRQLLTESVLLASFGGALGVLFAIWGVQGLTLLLSRGQENFTFRAEMNWNVLAVTAALSALCGLLFGLAPALQSTRPDVMPALKNGRFGGPRRGMQHLLVIAQIAMSFGILVAAGLFVRTLDKLHSVQVGYARENVLLFNLNARQAGHRDPQIAVFYESLRKRFEAIAGVKSATFSHASMIRAGQAGKTYRGAVKIGNTTVDSTTVMSVGPHFLRTMQIPVIAGREIDERDQQGSTGVVIINEKFARTYFGNENPLGRRLTFVDAGRELEIIGVSANIRVGSLKSEETPMTVFAAANQFSPEGITYALRTAGDPLKFVSVVHATVQEADTRIPVTNVLTQAAEIDRTIAREATFAKLCTAFAILALVIASVGLYGTTSYNVARQTGEIGIRMALGAQRGVVVSMILRRVLLLVIAGLVISVPVTLAGSRLVRSFLFGVQPSDPGTLTLAAVIMASAAVLAGYLPALRASRIDPMMALRHE